MIPSTVIVRCDGSRELGTGHVFRCLTLAEAIRSHGHDVVFLCRELDGAPLHRISMARFPIETLPADLDEALEVERIASARERHRARWIVLDRYATPESTYNALSGAGARILAVDDLCMRAFPVDILVNQNLQADRRPYLTRPDTLKLLGPDFALVRDVYRESRPDSPRRPAKVREVLVFLGGGDSGGAIGAIVKALIRLGEDLTVNIVMGASCAIRDEVEADLSNDFGRVHFYHDLPDLAALMLRTDLAIVAGGGVTWELCCMGVPMLLLSIAYNQEWTAARMHEQGAAIWLGRAEEIDEPQLSSRLAGVIARPSALAELAERAFPLVDGMGSRRIISAMKLEEPS